MSGGGEGGRPLISRKSPDKCLYPKINSKFSKPSKFFKTAKFFTPSKLSKPSKFSKPSKSNN